MNKWKSAKKEKPTYTFTSDNFNNSDNIVIFDGCKIDLGTYTNGKFVSIGIFSDEEFDTKYWLPIPKITKEMIDEKRCEFEANKLFDNIRDISDIRILREGKK